MTAGSFPGTAGRVGVPLGGKGLRDVLGVAPVVIDARGRIVLRSAQTGTLFGFLADEALGPYVARVIVDWDHRAEAMRFFGEVLRGVTAWTVTFPVRHKDGSTRRVEFRSMRLTDDLGDLYALKVAADGAVVEPIETEPTLSDRLVSQSPIGLALPGDKTALVVEDVMGSGIDAAATMGRVRTATCAFADLDLSPAQVLRYLDRITAGLENYLATCLFVAYHRVRQRCRIANAGRLPPLRSPADGPVELVQMSTGVPLGVVGGTFWTARVPFRPRDRLVPHTDGLIETRHEAIDERLDKARGPLEKTRGPLEKPCDRFLRALRRTGAPADVALLIARSTG
ncbi:SpoIIE family protein phosphatase [Streptomyces sp. NPDC059524]|uniref:SpoIIE family protein phosphatase n=1 Tax=Streptomyces sp. NPDC059524 TaxID=3346856 RepID=UPI0036A23DBA